MNPRTLVILCVLALFVAGMIVSEAYGQSPTRKPEFADEIDTILTRAGEDRNRQKFFSILIFVVLGGACTYATLRGIKKIVSVD